MDKRSRKKIDVARQRLTRLQQQISGARRQLDDPAEVDRLEQEIRRTKAEIERLKQS